MGKTRQTAIAALLFTAMLIFASLIWSGCSEETLSPVEASQISMLPGNPVAIAKAIDVQNKHTDELLAMPNVIGTGTGVDEAGQPVIKVFISGMMLSVAKIATELDGFKVEVEETGPFKAFALTARYRPVPIGVSVGNNLECAAGTIGCVVYVGGQQYILSNNHVLARENLGVIGEDIVQPGRYDISCADHLSTDKVADLSDFEPLKFDGTDNYIDAAIAQYSTPDVTCATLSTYYGTPGSSIVPASIGLAVKKVGRTTSLTTGTISAINVTVSVGYTHGTAKFVGQFMTSKKFCKSGDSGSLVVTNDASDNPVGLLFGGTNTGQAICCPIQPVLDRFGAAICTQ